MASPENGSPAPSSARHSRFQQILREPLGHFLLIGAVLFGLSAWRGREPAAVGPKQIVLTEGDLAQMVAAWREQGRPEPSPAQFQNLLEAKIREEVLYREGLSLGLDKEDTVVKRRLAQKMDFLAEDVSALREPTREELQGWLKAHPQDFAYPPLISFRHLFFSFDKHREQTREAAAGALAKVAGLAADASEVAPLGDRFLFENAYAECTPDHVGRIFGAKFARALFEQKPGGWAGPVESGFGWHLVFIEALTPARAPEFAEVERDVKADWMADQRAGLKRAAFEALRSKYQIVLPARPAANEEAP